MVESDFLDKTAFLDTKQNQRSRNGNYLRMYKNFTTICAFLINYESCWSNYLRPSKALELNHEVSHIIEKLQSKAF